jgi:hypothetical protein
MIELLINLSDIRKVRQNIDANITDAMVSNYIEEAQNLDIKPFIGDGLLIQLLNAINGTPTAAETLLLEGGTYTYGGHSYMFKGIKTILSYFAYSKIIGSDSYKITPSGVVTKKNDVSEIISDASLSRLIKISENIAIGYRLDLLSYLNRFTTTYPEFIYYEKFTKYSNQISHPIGK